MNNSIGSRAVILALFVAILIGLASIMFQGLILHLTWPTFVNTFFPIYAEIGVLPKTLPLMNSVLVILGLSALGRALFNKPINIKTKE